MAKENEIHQPDNASSDVVLHSAPDGRNGKKSKKRKTDNGGHVDQKLLKATVAAWETARDAKEIAEAEIAKLKLEESNAIAAIVALVGSGPHAYKGGRIKFMCRKGLWFPRGGNLGSLPVLA